MNERNATQERPARKTFGARLRRVFVWLGRGLLMLIAVGLWNFFFWNPLPNDDVMIEHFNKHRPVLERLAELRRNYFMAAGAQPLLWKDLLEVKALYEEADVRRVAPIGSEFWLPNPYSPDRSARADDLIKNATSVHDTDRYRAIAIDLAPKEYMRGTLRYAFIWKNLWHFPEVPRVEDGWLLRPANRKGNPTKRDRVLKSLNHYPWGWEPGECFFRQLEPQWFIQLCRQA